MKRVDPNYRLTPLIALPKRLQLIFGSDDLSKSSRRLVDLFPRGDIEIDHRERGGGHRLEFAGQQPNETLHTRVVAYDHG